MIPILLCEINKPNLSAFAIFEMTLIQISTDLDIQPPPVRTQARPLVGRGLDLAVIDPQGLQPEGRAVWKEKGRKKRNS